MEERCHELEEDIARTEVAIANCETALQAFVSNEETLRVTQELNRHREELEALMAEWEDVAHALQE